MGRAARGIASPIQFVTTGEDNLRIISANSVAGVKLALRVRRLDAEKGELQIDAYDHTPNTDRSAKTEDYHIAAGAVLSVHVVAVAGTPLIGTTFVMVQLIRSMGAVATVLATLMSGSVTTVQAIGWPGSAIEGSTSVEPVVRNILGTLPGLGNPITETCPTGARWELISVYAEMVTDASFGDRTLGIRMNSSAGNKLAYTFTSNLTVQAPSTTTRYTFAQNIPVNNRPAGVAQIPFAQRQILLAGDFFEVNGQGGGDQLTAPSYQVREWLEVG